MSKELTSKVLAHYHTPRQRDAVARDVASELNYRHDPNLGAPVKVVLETVLKYYQRTVGVGHTQALMSGIGFIHGGGVRPTVVVHNETMGRVLSGNDFIPLSEFYKMENTRKPLLWDNGALVLLLASAVKEIERLEELVDYRARERAKHLLENGEDDESTNLVDGPRT